MAELTGAKRDWADYIIMEEIPLTAECDKAEMVADIEAQVRVLTEDECRDLLEFALS